MIGPPPFPAGPRWRNAVIEQIVRRTPAVISVFLRASLDPWEAGQHVDVRLTAEDGYQAQRSYSIASAPGAERLELAIERLDDGEVSPFFHDVARPADSIELRGPIGGHFVWRTADGGPILLIAGGSGIVPLMAISRHRAATAPATAALLVYSARTWEDVVFRDELLAIEASDVNFRLVLTTTRGRRGRAQDFERRLDAGLLRQLLAGWPHVPRRVYVCGSNAFVEAVTTLLPVAAIAADSIRTERYGDATPG